MKRIFFTIILLSTLTTISSCKEEDENPCSDDFNNDLAKIESNFRKVYTANSSSAEFENFRNEIQSFITKYPDKCEANGKELNPTPSLKVFLEVTKSEKKSFAKVIYGNDDRQDIANATDSRYKDWSKSVAVQISSSEIGSDGSLSTETIQESMSLCSSERFVQQINPGRCSGFLVGKDLLVTAGHCIQNQSECDSHSWVFGFEDGVTKAAAQNTYKCKSIVSRQLDDQTNADFAVVKLDREVENREPLKFRKNGKVSNNAPIVVIGHPSGLPMKVAAGANVRTNTDKWFFVGNLDTFGGNSGSPVFNNDSGIVEGVLVRGENDYNWEEQPDGSYCKVTNRCNNDECRGEDVTRMTMVTGLPDVLDNEEVYKQLYANEQTSKEAKGISFPVYIRKDGDNFIGGIKFLDECGIHYANLNSSSDWIESKVVNCEKDKDQLLRVIDGYIGIIK